MSRNRYVLSRPRTKVYDANYSMGEQYYKSALDGIDRKYGRASVPDAIGVTGGLRASLDRERPADLTSPRSTMKELEGDEFFDDFNRKKSRASAVLAEFDSLFESRMKNGMQNDKATSRSAKPFEDEIEEDLSSSMKRLRAMKSARECADGADEGDGASNSKSGGRNPRSKLDFSEKVMDSVGLAGKAWSVAGDETVLGKRKVLKITATESSEGENLTKWTALKSRRPTTEKDEPEPIESAAASRARKSRARLEDLEAEMQAIAERGAAREKRVRDLKALVQENETSSIENLHSTMRVKNSIHSEKKIVSF